MGSVQELLSAMGQEILPVLEKIDQEQMLTAVNTILSARTLFLSGMGRSGYIMRCFAMRLAQMGLSVHVVGDATTPSAGSGDLLILGTSSGETASLKLYAQKARQVGCTTLVLTAQSGSTLGKAADCLVHLPLAEAPRKDESGAMRALPSDNRGQRLLLGSRMEVCLMMVTEALAMLVFQRRGMTETDMALRHACFE